jgi:hypothetical protein
MTRASEAAIKLPDGRVLPGSAMPLRWGSRYRLKGWNNLNGKNSSRWTTLKSYFIVEKGK